MTETIRTISYRDPNSFGDFVVTEVGQRVLFRGKMGDTIETLQTHEPEVFTLDEFKDEIEKLGVLTRFETYIDSDSFFEVTRGSVVVKGIEHFFHTMYPIGKLYKGYVTGVISTIQYTRVLEND